MLNGFKTNLRVCIVRFWVILYKNRTKKLREDRKKLKPIVKEIMDKYSAQNEQAFLYKRKSVVKDKKDYMDLDVDQIFGTLSEIIG